MSFTWPMFLLALAMVPLGAAAYYFSQRRKSKYAVRFTNLDLLANVVDSSPGWRRHVPPALYLLSLGALIFALARPHTSLQVPKEEATVVLVMDVSGSMRATDVEPTRLDAAKESAKALVNKLPDGFQLALVTFSNNVSTLVAPTADKQAILDALDGLKADRGTAMGDGLFQALDLAKPLPASDSVTAPGATPSARPRPTPIPTAGKDGRPAILVLLSDGANSTGFSDPIDVANDAKARGVPIFTVALGTQTGVVDVTDNVGRTRRIQVPPDEETLMEIAKITEAKFFSAPSAEDLDSIYSDLGSKIGYDNKDREITVAFAGAATVLVIVAGALSLLWFNRFP